MRGKIRAADHLWKPGDQLNFSGSVLGGSRFQGPDVQLDVTSIVQSWADSPSSNKGFALDGDETFDIYHMVILSSTCVTAFKTATLDVTYY